MPSISNRRGLRDLRTAISSRVHAKPPQEGTAYLSLYLLNTEAQRLEMELASLEHRQRRVQTHLKEIYKTMARLNEEAQMGAPLSLLHPEPAAGGNPPARDYGQRQWKKMTLDY